MYLHDPRTVGVRDVMSERETPPQGPAFRLECAAGCPPLAANRCRAVVRQANVDAIELARNAAMALESTPPSREAARLFRAFFGHDPSRPVPWAGNRFFRGGVVLHEMLHLLYHQFFHHAGRHGAAIRSGGATTPTATRRSRYSSPGMSPSPATSLGAAAGPREGPCTTLRRAVAEWLWLPG
jgi:hypothetical protein